MVLIIPPHPFIILYQYGEVYKFIKKKKESSGKFETFRLSKKIYIPNSITFIHLKLFLITHLM